jgi:hypothetical protein
MNRADTGRENPTLISLYEREKYPLDKDRETGIYQGQGEA